MLCHYHAFWYKFDGYWTYTQIPVNRSSYQQRNVLKQQGKKSRGGGRERGKGSRTTILSLVFPPNLLSWRSKINPNSISSLISSSYTLVSSLATRSPPPFCKKLIKAKKWNPVRSCTVCVCNLSPIFLISTRFCIKLRWVPVNHHPFRHMNWKTPAAVFYSHDMVWWGAYRWHFCPWTPNRKECFSSSVTVSLSPWC